MAFKKTGEMYKPKEISIMICDVCGKEIGLPDGYGSRPHYMLIFETANQNQDNIDWDICSKECLIKLAKEKL